jgi:predicted  nucleic acid-binding Zn-ribbon protein
MGEPDRPYSRTEYNRALVANALLQPFNVVLLAGMLIAGLVIGKLALVLPIALAVYVAAVVRSYFDEDEAAKVLARERGERRGRLDRERPRVDPRSLAPPIRRLVEAAHDREERIRAAIERADLDYVEVCEEVDRFVHAIEATAARAELLHEALADSPPDEVERRLREVEGDPARAELGDALRHQLAVQRRMEQQLARFHDQIERLLVELDTVRGNLVSVSASTEAASQQRLAAEVRGMREELSALAEGMSVAYEDGAEPRA